jgi:Domain of unknown function (DUF4389)
VEPSNYPVAFSVDYPDRKLNRLSSFFRIFAAIPILIISGLIAGGSYGEYGYDDYVYVAGAGMGLVALPAALMILFRQKYPRWWFEWNLELMRFLNRIDVYLALMDDQYPSTDEQQSVHLSFSYPDVEADLSRGMPIVKWFLAIPHYFVLFFLGIGAFFAIVMAWFAILFTGRYPRGLFTYVEGVLRWYNRVIGYAFTLVTDRYPPFRLSA